MSKFLLKKKYRINLIISISIFIGFFLTLIIHTATYNSIIKEDIQNISKLSSTNIYSEINNELTKPIFVSLTMANDSFLINWLEREKMGLAQVDELSTYLNGLKNKYDYNSVFLVSATTLDYYHYKGLNKTVSKEDEHDQWYFNFLALDKPYVLDVDVDEVDNNTLTIFVNCRIEDPNGTILGVVGVGLEMDEVQRILATFENAYDLEAFLVDEDGLVQVHTNNSLIESYNINEDEYINNFSDEIFSNKSSLESFRYNEHGIDGYLITRYVDELDWTLFVRKDTSVLQKTFYSQIGEVTLVVFIVILAVTLLINNVIKGYQDKMNAMTVTDELTSLLNRRGFNRILSVALSGSDPFTAFIFDIDDFKKLNDKYGHLFGDKIISLLAYKCQQVIGEHGTVARWGGDEFAGLISLNQEDATSLLNALQEQIDKDPTFSEYHITISIGATGSRLTDTPDLIYSRADRALYISKNQGKNRLTFL